VLARYRERVLAALEPFRAQKHAPLDARVTIAPLAADRPVLEAARAELADLFVVSAVVLAGDTTGAEPSITVEQAPGTRCARCWKYFEGAGELDPRCASVVAGQPKVAS
jgi:hypothetical protein